MNEKLEDLDRIDGEVEDHLPPILRKQLAFLRKVREALSEGTP